MAKEFEQTRFRPGESANRPYGGHVADAPFAKALRDLVVDRGFESQNSLAKALGKSSSRNIMRYYRDKAIPSPEEFGNLLVLLQPNDEKMDKLVYAYAEEVGRGRGISGGVRPETRIKISEARMKHSGSPFGQWVENFCSTKGITLNQWFSTVGLTTHVGIRGGLGLENLSRILENTPVAFGLSEEETEGLSEAVVLEIQQRLEKGKRFQDSPSGRKIKKMQENLVCRIYNGAEVAIELGVTREAVSQLRQKLGLPILMREDDVNVLKEEFDKTKALRDIRQQTRLKNQSTEAMGSQ